MLLLSCLFKFLFVIRSSALACCMRRLQLLHLLTLHNLSMTGGCMLLHQNFTNSYHLDFSHNKFRIFCRLVNLLPFFINTYHCKYTAIGMKCHIILLSRNLRIKKVLVSSLIGITVVLHEEMYKARK